MNHPITLIIKEYGKILPIYEIPNYTGYLPHIMDWIKIPSPVGQAQHKIQGRDFEYQNSKLISVILWI